MERAHLLARRRAEEERAATARAELLATAGPDEALPDRTELSVRGLHALQRVLAPAVAAMGPRRPKGEAVDGGLRCVVERRPGDDLAVTTPEGTLVLHGLAITVFRDEEL